MKVLYDGKLIEIDELEQGFYFIIDDKRHEVYPLIEKGELEKKINDLKSKYNNENGDNKIVGVFDGDIKVKGPFRHLDLVIKS